VHFLFRVESQHWKLKQMLEHSKGDLCRCFEAMNDNMSIQVDNIKASFRKSFYYNTTRKKVYGGSQIAAVGL
jgi:hypothetical protein